MSVTFTCKRMVNVFEDSHGKKVFVMNEVTYESNLFPHTKRVSVVGIGNIETCMEIVFRYSSATEGGSLNSPDRCMTPERYIKSWINALKKPYDYSGMENRNVADMDPPWWKDGYEKLMADLQQNPPSTYMIKDVYEKIQQYHLAAILPSTFTDNGKPLTELSGISGYEPKKAVSEVFTDARIVRLKGGHEDHYFLTNEFGESITVPEWEYSVVSDFVCNSWESELLCPGTYKTWIPAFRQALRSAPYADPEKILVRPKSNLEEYAQKRSDEYREKYGDEFRLSKVDSEDLYYIMSSSFDFMADRSQVTYFSV